MTTIKELAQRNKRQRLARNRMTDARVTSPPSTPALRELLAKATLPWAYRPVQFDDWGYIRAPEKQSVLIGPYRPIVAVARDSDVTEADMSAHRIARTDPYEPHGQLIVAAVNALPALLDEIDTLKESLAAAEGERDAARAEGKRLDYRVRRCEAALRVARGYVLRDMTRQADTDLARLDTALRSPDHGR